MSNGSKNQEDRSESISTIAGDSLKHYANLESSTDEKRTAAVQAFVKEYIKSYRIVTDPENLDLRTFNDCLGKTIRLKEALDGLGMETDFVTCKFYWSSLDLPSSVLEVPHDDVGTHLFLTYKYADPSTGELEWRVADPTWHPGIGVRLRSTLWDGVHGTPLAVSPNSLPIKVDSHNSEALADIYNTDWIAEDLDKNGAFYNALNAYFEEIETKPVKV